MSKKLYIGHNPLDIDGDSNIIDTPFYYWLVLQHDGGYDYTSLTGALEHYLSLRLGQEFITDKQHWCYKCILETFVEKVVLCQLTQ